MHRHLASVRLDDRARNRKPNFHSLPFRGDERQEKPRSDFRRDTMAGVGDIDRDHAVTGGRGHDRQLAAVGAFQCLERVAQEIEQDLLNLDLIDQNKVDDRVELKVDPNRFLLGGNQGKRARFLDKLRDAFDPSFSFAARDEVAQALDDVAGCIACSAALSSASKISVARLSGLS